MNFGEKLGYFSLKGVLKGISLLPFGVLYGISDTLAWTAHSVARYRVRVVRDNLRSAFPGKSEKEIRRIGWRFYRFLTDYMVETVKMLSMSEKKMKRHFEVTNPEMVDDAMEAGRNVVLYLGHYCNWEWISSLPAYFSPGRCSAQVYHHLHSKVMDRLFMDIRTRFGANNIEMDDIGRRLIEWKRAGVPTVTGFISDQAPNYNIHLFLDFLNHDTPVFTGAERMARFLDADVLYCHVERPKRGYYRLTFERITSAPGKEATFDITKKYFEMLERDIKAAPQFWLWSHRRWKRTREGFNQYWGDKAEAQLSRL